MWTRTELKDRAKAIMHTDYWKVFLICLIAALLGATSGTGASSSGFEVSTDTGVQFNFNLGPLDFNFPLGNYLYYYGIVFAMMFLAAVIGSIILGVFIVNVLRVGFCRYLILTQRTGHSADASELFWGFTCGHYMNLVKVMFLYDLYIFLWGLCFIIPGIVKAYAYTFVPYILAEHPDMDASEVLALSTQMTDGEKFNIFVLELSFIGWYFLGSLLFGIGTYFVNPYAELTNGELYAVLRRRIWPDNDGSDPYQSYGRYQEYTY